jgi:hypothetical protein
MIEFSKKIIYEGNAENSQGKKEYFEALHTLL